MKLQRISVLPLSRILCVFQALIGLVLGLIVAIGSLTGQQDEGLWSLGSWSLLVFPVVNAALGFLTGAFFASAYNLFSKWFGCIEFEVES